jgi:methyltransferase (TIGR00027 family)
VKEKTASWTALFVAGRRAVESEKPAAERICDDPLAEKFIGRIPLLFVKILLLWQRLRHKRLRTYVLLRCRFFDDYLRECLASGVTQVVILGAGWDSRAYRGELLEKRIRTFEVDHPATQARKIRSVKNVFPAIPDHIVYVPIDFSGGSLDPLLDHGYDPLRRTLFLLEGVVNYLETIDVESMLSWIGSRAAPHSRIIMDYQQLPNAQSPFTTRRELISSLSRSVDERLRFGADQLHMKALLDRKGFSRIEETDSITLAEKYLPGSGSTGRRRIRSVILSAEIGSREPVSETSLESEAGG